MSTNKIPYESWRISYQSSEQAARAAYAECERLREELKQANKEIELLHQSVMDNYC